MNQNSWGTFPFGAPVRPCGVDLPTGAKAVLILGAYPSAFHVRWVPPEPWKPITALPVDNEPTPFWDGDASDAERLFKDWKAEHFRDGWGSVSPAQLNGSSGAKLEELWLAPLGYSRDDAAIVDCLPLSRASVGVRKRQSDTYDPFARQAGAPTATLQEHPSESEIVREALSSQAERLIAQIEAARPELIVTLGNAGARVVAALDGQEEGTAVLDSSSYGRPRSLDRLGSARWQALIHPAAPVSWRTRHKEWMARSER
jgi:uracil-DNA glycosylase